MVLALDAVDVVWLVDTSVDVYNDTDVDVEAVELIDVRVDFEGGAMTLTVLEAPHSAKETPSGQQPVSTQYSPARQYPTVICSQRLT